MHRSHDYRHLITRWRAVCRAARLRLSTFSHAGKYPLYYVQTTPAGTPGSIYLSAGIHGDEPAGPESLVTWAEADPARLRELPLLIFPCLNPWGLINNIRFAVDGSDLNRIFHRDEIPFVADWKRVLQRHTFELALLFHEDFDGQGLYLYEVGRQPPTWGEQLLEAAQPVIPIEGRTRIDRFTASAGVIRRRWRMAQFKSIGFPEAIWLHLHHAQRTFTVESPSEFALPQRALALRALLERGIELIKASQSPPLKRLITRI